MATKVLTRYIGNTNPPIRDTLTELVTDPTTGDMTEQRVNLDSSLVSSVHFMAQNPETGEAIDQVATIDQVTVNPNTWGDVRYQPQAGDVDGEVDWISWWRVNYITGGPQDTAEFIWSIRPHGIAATPNIVPTGVCTAWADNDDVWAYTDAAVDQDFTRYIIEASELLYILAGRRYPGICEQTVRPARTGNCGCWQVLSRGHIVAPTWQWTLGWWCDDTGEQVGCGTTSQVRLAGYVQAITEVKISGVVVDPATYRVDHNEQLVRVTDPATGQNPGWPLCQNMSLADNQPGTFSVKYTWGRRPPMAGVRAASQLAYQLYLSDNPRQGKCRLPAGWTSISRQGVTISRQAVQRLAVEGTGLTGIDSFLSTYNPNQLDRDPAVYSPDVAPFAERTGP